MMSSSPRVIQSVAELVQWRRSITGRVGLVPTMGALHEGHATLLREARPQCDVSVLTIFVNPTQFGSNEDLSKYPRTFENDLKIAQREGADVVFAPTPTEIYPAGYTTYVEETGLSVPLCGKFRPGHFRGVTTIVLKLFHLVRPHLSFFGLKDAQQFFVIKKMVEDLNLDTEVIGVPTVREPDGLALSSRNVYLSSDDREIAPRLYQTLSRVAKEITESLEKSVEINLTEILNDSIQYLEKNQFQVQYLECLQLPNLESIKSSSLNRRVRSIRPEIFNFPSGNLLDPSRSYLLAAAACLGKTRLIDNIIIQSG